MTVPVLTIAFDYSTLPADMADEARLVVTEFRALQRRTVEGMAEIGRKLISIRDRLDHGQFLPWIEAEIGSKSSAYRCIAIAERFEPAILPTLGSLDLTTVHALASNTTPDAVRQEIVSRLATGEPLAIPVAQEMIARAKSLVKQEKILAKVDKKKLEARRRRDARRRGVSEELRQRHRAEHEREQAVARRAAELVADRLGDDLPIFRQMIQEVGIWKITEALYEVAAERAPQQQAAE